MGTQWRPVTIAVASGLLLAGAQLAGLRAQTPGPAQLPGLPTEITQIRHNAGQSVVPYYEGWIKNADGTFDLVWGYFNRNWQQEFAIPTGAENRVDPGGPDGGQPTYFLPRRQRFVYRQRVPADFGKKEAVWTLTANGRTERGYATLQPEQEITERVVATNGNFNPGHNDPNQPPSVTLAPVSNVAVGAAIRLVASVVDDGLPKPRVVAPPPPPKPTESGRPNFGAQVNSSGGGRPRGLTLTWLQYRGPGKVTFETTGPIAVSNGEAVTTARFAAPGTYRLIANANDGSISRKVEINITVTGSSSENR
jgi:hypothetical protein